jgi:hypothetical protein
MLLYIKKNTIKKIHMYQTIITDCKRQNFKKINLDHRLLSKKSDFKKNK